MHFEYFSRKRRISRAFKESQRLDGEPFVAVVPGSAQQERRRQPQDHGTGEGRCSAWHKAESETDLLSPGKSHLRVATNLTHSKNGSFS